MPVILQNGSSSKTMYERATRRQDSENAPSGLTPVPNSLAKMIRNLSENQFFHSFSVVPGQWLLIANPSAVPASTGGRSLGGRVITVK